MACVPASQVRALEPRSSIRLRAAGGAVGWQGDAPQRGVPLKSTTAPAGTALRGLESGRSGLSQEVAQLGAVPSEDQPRRTRHQGSCAGGRTFMFSGLETLHKDDVRNLYSGPSISSIIKSRSFRWTGHVASKGRPGI